ncbi:30S ribosomal protein S4 [Candidatus Adlerbacteria bacterium RIFCSPLOWO2_01_FULL_51_16]|uniref:Small ribosomal subunit protein uS4 n=1 Tax=Candidatus Adlerbacteria bacterium RIFCSPLOWO2_01_FULL_51_16 TaxID=1797243 RepID=A0A1F4XEI9_9BACT|nr:MAG: 30S ribosomal protein S4 [Candidatus Adlerbacteria bacterium RIFCSPLOWO2_01_FULL_51_16]
MKVGPKYKICKRLGASVFEKCQTQKFQLAEARAPRKTKGKRGGGGDYGLQLLEKQKARFTYGMTEGQFARYAHEAMEHGQDSVVGLMRKLESRLDNVVYRLGFVKTRRAARQMVSHGHILVNGRRVNIPSYLVSLNDTVAIRLESRASALFVGRAEAAHEQKTPAWLKLSADGFEGVVTGVPGAEETELPFNAAVIIQFYSR